MPSQQQHQAAAGSTRWCPTPEQLMVLEETYRGGLRTPNASQIQQITAHLACYGRIEGKNVFYWFQNHKARDRQKLRRMLFMSQSHHLLSCAQYYAAVLAPRHGHQLLLSPSSTSPTPPAAAAAAAYGYYYSATAFAEPASRCAGNATLPSPTAQRLFHYHYTTVHLQRPTVGC
jgi:hypothetical protein